MKTREEIEQEWEVAVRTADYEHTHKLRVLAERRDAALAELDDPMLRLIAAAKKWRDNHALAFGECSHSVCVELRNAINYAEQRRAQGAGNEGS